MNNVAIAAAHVFINFHDEFAVGENFGVAFGERQIEMIAHRLRKIAPGAAGENLEVIAVSSAHRNTSAELRERDAASR